jgi:hypothetical protein
LGNKILYPPGNGASLVDKLLLKAKLILITFFGKLLKAAKPKEQIFIYVVCFV